MKTLASIFLTINVFITYSADYYWVGGSGNWTDFANHWATTSGGTTFHTTVPGTLDNVYIDDNSFTADGTIMLDDLGYCNDFDASGLTNFNVDLNPVTYNGAGADYLYIHGSMTGSAKYNSGLFYTYFLSTGMENITSNGGRLGVYLRFEEANGTWQMRDDVAGITGIALNLGSLVISDIETTTIRFFDVANSSNFKSLTLSNSYLDTDFFRIGNNNLTYSITNSTIAVERQFEVYANPMEVDDVVFLNLAELNVEGDWTMDNLLIEPGADVTIQSGTTLTTNQLTLGGDVETFLRSSTPGMEATLRQATGEVSGDFLNLTDIHATGGAAFITSGSTDNGNNTGWTFIKNYYWVGGSGNWSDLNHWATTSGGTSFHTTVPTAMDNVYFDANSFNAANEIVEIDGTFDCHDLTVDTDEAFTLRAAYLNNFSIYGSLFVNELANLALYNFWLKSDDAVTITVKTTTSSGNTMQLEGNGTYTFMHDFNLGYSIYCQSQTGTVDFNDFNITARQVYYTAGNLDLGSSVIDVSLFRRTNHNNFDAGTSTILVSEEFWGGGLTFNDVTFTNDNGSTGVNFLGSNTFNNLIIESGAVINIESSQTQTITNLVAQGTASEPITIQSSTPGIQTTLSQSSGEVDASNLVLQDIVATGGATFTASASTDNGNNTGWTFIKYYYWVGGSGNWTDFANHWATTSGGSTFHTTVPGTLDNVYIDDNSFTTDGTIMLDDLGYCNDFDASGLTNFNVNLNPVTYNGAGADYLYIHGSMTGSANYNSGLFYTYFLSTGMENITSNGGRLGVYLRFEEANGTWQIRDDVSGINGIALNLGSLVISDIETTTIRFFDVANSSNFKSLTLSNTYLDTDFFRIGNNNLTYSITNTTIAVEDQFEVYTNPMEVDDVIFLNLDQLNVEGNWTMDNLLIESGADVTILSGDTLTMNQLTLGGDVETFLRSSTPGTEATLRQATGEVSGDFLNLTDIHATGGAAFITSGSTDNGNNTGWTFLKDYYWVGGSGNWTDFANHWATTSGGTTFHTTVPGTLDNVYIDDNSFTTDGTIMLDDLGYCNDFDASGLTNYNVNLQPVTYNGTGADFLYIHGSMQGSSMYNSGLFFTYLLSTGVEEIISNGGRLGVYLSFEEANGTWNIKDDVTGILGIALNLGSLVISEVDTTTIPFFDVANSSNFKSLTLSNLYLDTDFFRIGNNNLTYSVTNTTIAVEDQFEVYANPMTLDDVIFLNQDQLNVEGNWTMNNLTIHPGADVTVLSGDTLVMNQLELGGEIETILRSSALGSEAFFSQASGTVSGEGLNIRDIHAIGGATFTAVASRNEGNNTGWTFVKGDQSINFTLDPDTVDLFHASFELAATATSGLGVYFTSSDESVARIQGDRQLIVEASGVTTITAKQDGNAQWNAAPDVAQVLVVTKAGQQISFDPLPDVTYGDAPFELQATASSGLPITFSAGDETIITITDNIVTIVAAGDVDITASQPGDSTYNAAEDIVRTLRVNKADQTINFNALTDINLGDTSIVLEATASSGLPVAFSVTGPATLEENILTPTGVGTVTVTASQTGDPNYNPAPEVVRNFNVLDVAKEDQTISFDSIPEKTYGDPPFELIASSSSGLNVTFQSSDNQLLSINGNIATIIGAGVVSVFAEQGGDENYNSTTTFQEVLINKAEQTITFSEFPDITFGDPPVQLDAVASSGLEVQYDVSGPVILEGTLLTPTGSGVVAVIASQSGNSNYNPAPDVGRTFNILVAKEDQTIDFDVIPEKTYGDPPFELTAFASSGLTVTFQSSDEQILTINETTAIINGAGAVTLFAEQGGDENFNSVTTFQEVLINKADQSITFSELPDISLDDPPVQLDATASSGLEVQYDVSGPVILEGTVLTPTGSGTVAVIASQSGNSNFNPAPNVGRTFNILDASKEDQTITFDAIPEKIYGDAPFELVATSSSGLPVTFQTSDELVITVSGTLATIVGAGVATITASQDGDENYNAVNTSQEVFVNKADQVITFNELTDITFGDPPVQLDATASSGLEVQYDVTGPASLEGTTLTPTGPGTVTVTAKQNGNDNFNSAIEVVRLFEVLDPSKLDQAISFDPLPNRRFGDANFALDASSTSNLEITYESSNHQVATVNGNIVSINDVGITEITASQLGDNTYNPAEPVTQLLTIEKGLVTISITNLSYEYDGLPKSVAVTTIPSGLDFSVTYDGSTDEPVDPGLYQVLVTIISELYEGTATATFEIFREPEQVTITVSNTEHIYDGSPKEVTVSTVPSVAYEVTYDGGVTPPVNAASYQVHIEVTEDYYFGSADVTMTISKGLAEVFFDSESLTQTYDGTVKEVTYSTQPEGLMVQITYNELEQAPVNSGTYVVEAVIDEMNYEGIAQESMEILVAQAEVIFDENSLEQEFDGDPKPVSATTNPAGLNILITYNGSTDPPVNANDNPGYEVIATIDELNYEGQAIGTLIVHPGLLLRTTVPEKLSVYPNPVNTKLHVRMENLTGIDWVIRDISGKQLLKGSSQNDLVIIDVSGLTAGIYYLLINQDEQVRIRIN